MPKHQSPVNIAHHDDASLGDRLADKMAERVGSWPFIITQTAILVAWVAVNAVGAILRWDPYPFILLNLCLSFQAAYTGPILLISQNRQADRDRLKAEHDFRVNREALRLIRKVADAKGKAT